MGSAESFLSLSHIQATSIFLATTIITYLIYTLKRRYEYWKDRNVPQIGFSGEFLTRFWHHRTVHYQTIYDKFAPKHPYVGFYSTGTPYLMTLDPELVRSICIKNFSYFTDHGQFDVDSDPLQRDALFNLKGHKWRALRNKLSPIFTSGKLKHMYLLLHECTEYLDKVLSRALAKSPEEVEVLELCQKFTISTIGVCAYGMSLSTIEEEGSEFQRMLERVSSPWLSIKLLIVATFPKVFKFLGLKLAQPKVEGFFRSVVDKAITERQNASGKPQDLVQLLIHVRAEEEKMLADKGDNSEPLFTDDVCMANAFVFFAAGFDAVTIGLAHCLYELALHPEVMDKLHEEILQVTSGLEGPPDYDVMKKMEYLDCVISETLRLHPSGGSIERECTEPYQLPDSSLTLTKGTHVLIPLFSLHRDPRFWPNPLKFDPDRFNEENKADIVPGTYLPFGDGPRICIAQRFALMNLKAALVHIVGKYTIHPSPKTAIPLKLSPIKFAATPSQVYLKLRKREEK